jgi:hypothetical protein
MCISGFQHLHSAGMKVDIKLLQIPKIKHGRSKISQVSDADYWNLLDASPWYDLVNYQSCDYGGIPWTKEGFVPSFIDIDGVDFGDKDKNIKFMDWQSTYKVQSEMLDQAHWNGSN